MARHRKNVLNPAADELRGLLRDLPLAYFRLKATGDRLAAKVGQTTGKWGVMRTLHAEGPRTVAQIARSRPVARQWVQYLANELEAEQLIEFIENPQHRRSKLMRLTPKGRRVLERMVNEEIRLAGRLAGRFKAKDLRVARDVLRRMREVLTRVESHFLNTPRNRRRTTR